MNSAKLIAEKIDRTGFEAGYDWCISCLRDVGCTKLANEVHLAKASKFLSSKEFEAAISVFKVCECGGGPPGWLFSRPRAARAFLSLLRLDDGLLLSPTL